MTMPKKKSRSIVVNGERYRWMMNSIKTNVIVENTDTGVVNSVQVIDEERKYFMDNDGYTAIQPAHVKAIIMSNFNDDFLDYMEEKTCSCGNKGTYAKSICVYDAEIRPNDSTTKFCNCCKSCRDMCAADI